MAIVRRCVWCSTSRRGFLFKHPLTRAALYSCCTEHARKYCRWVMTHKQQPTKNPRGNQ